MVDHAHDWVLERPYVRQILQVEADLAAERRQLKAGTLPNGTWLLARELLWRLRGYEGRSILSELAKDLEIPGCGHLVAHLVEALYPVVRLAGAAVSGKLEQLDEILDGLPDPCPNIRDCELPPHPGRHHQHSSGRPCPDCRKRHGYNGGPCGPCYWNGTLPTDVRTRIGPLLPEKTCEREGCGRRYRPFRAQARFCTLMCGRLACKEVVARDDPATGSVVREMVCAERTCRKEFTASGQGVWRRRFCGLQCQLANERRRARIRARRAASSA